MSSARIISKLLNAGFSEEDVDNMDRKTLVGAWAECIAAGRDTETAVTEQDTDIKPPPAENEAETDTEIKTSSFRVTRTYP